MDTKLFIPILNELKIDEKHHDKVLKYIDVHMCYELNHKVSNIDILKESTLPLALHVLSKINLNNVNFIDNPNTGDVGVSTYSIKLKFNDFDLESIPNLEMFFSHEFVEETVIFLNKKINDNFYIYLLFTEIKNRDENGNIYLFHRFGNKVL